MLLVDHNSLEYSLDNKGDILKIGRGDLCTIQVPLPDSEMDKRLEEDKSFRGTETSVVDLTSPHRVYYSVAREHAIIDLQERKITPIKPKNEKDRRVTQINGRDVGYEGAIFEDGNIITLGAVNFKFYEKSEE